jgi:hypothetical protein
LLVGPRCQQLQVANPGRYNFDRQALLLSMVQLATQLGKHAEFLQVGCLVVVAVVVVVKALLLSMVQLATQLGKHLEF